jgi:hypothetical protein
MLILVSALIAFGLIIWAIRMKKYAQALFALVALGGINSFVFGVCSVPTSQGGWLIAIGLAALFAVAVAVKLLYFHRSTSHS